MERPIVLVYKGRLIYVCQDETSIELESVGFDRQSGFSGDTVSKSKLTSKLHWDIEDVKPCVDDRTGLNTLFILASCKSESDSKRFCIIQVNWRSRDVFSHVSKSARESSVELMPFLELKCTTDVSESAFCALTCGPRAVLVGQNKIWLFGRKAKEWNVVQSSEFMIVEKDIAHHDLQNTTSSARSDNQRHNQIESKILSLASEEDWVVALLLISNKSCTSVVAIALERNAGSDEFNKKTLRTRDFLPQEYASKVSTVTIQACRRSVAADQSCLYENVCAVGLNDGYAMLFVNGMPQTCATPWMQSGAVYPAFAATEVLSFNDDVLVCHTDTKDCFVINGTTNKVSIVVLIVCKCNDNDDVVAFPCLQGFGGRFDESFAACAFLLLLLLK